MIATFSDLQCQKLRVTGSSENGSDGNYTISEFKSSSTVHPVFKKSGYDRYIFYRDSIDGWRIGSHDDLTNGRWFFRSKSKIEID